MSRFAYKGFDIEGNADDGLIEGRDTADAFATLKSRGIVVVELKDEAKGQKDDIAWYSREITFGTVGHSLNDQAAFSELLGRLAELNLPLTEMLRILATNSKNAAMSRHVHKTAARVMDGEEFSQAFASSGSGFSPMFLQILRIGFIANTLPTSMQNLAKYLRRADETRSRIITALIYPGILVAAVFVLLAVIAGFLAPALAPMFSSLDKPIPNSLGFFLMISSIFEKYWYVFIAAVTLTFILATLIFGSAKGNLRRSQLLWKIPFIGSISKEAFILRHTAALDILLSSGMPLPEALDSAAKLGVASPFEATLTAVAIKLRSGQRASDVFKSETGLPEIFIDLFSVGAEANKLEETLKTLVDILDQSLQRRLQKILQLLAPLLTVVLGGVIGILVYSVMGAILDINTIAF